MASSQTREYTPILKWLKLSAITLSCHNDAVAYWKFWQDLSREFSIHNKLDEDTLELILTVDPIHICPSKSGARNYDFFGGFSSLALARSANLEKALFSVYDARRPDLVHAVAQGSILKCLAHSLHPNDGLPAFYEAFKHHLWPSRQNKSSPNASLLGGKHLTIRSLAELAGRPEDTLKSQIKAFRRSRSTPTGFLDKILKAAEDEQT